MRRAAWKTKGLEPRRGPCPHFKQVLQVLLNACGRTLLFVWLAILTACQSPATPSPPHPLVLVSIAPYARIVKKLAPELVDVSLLVPPGANPHIYETTAQQLQTLKRAELWIYLGENLDKKVRHFLEETRPSLPIVDLAKDGALYHEHSTCSSHDDDDRDLHMWLSPRLLKGHSQQIAQALIQLLPEHEAAIRHNLTLFLEEVDRLDIAISRLTSPKKGSSLLVSHPAFGYFCQDYGLQQLSIEIAGKDPKPHDIASLLQRAQKENITLLITEPQHSNKGAEAVCAALGLTSHQIDPYSEDYESTLLDLAELIAHG